MGCYILIIIQKWFELQEKKVEKDEDEIAVEIPLSLRLEPAQFSFTESIVGSDGTVFMTSFEDDEDVTIEVIEDV